MCVCEHILLVIQKVNSTGPHNQPSHTPVVHVARGHALAHGVHRPLRAAHVHGPHARQARHDCVDGWVGWVGGVVVSVCARTRPRTACPTTLKDEERRHVPPCPTTTTTAYTHPSIPNTKLTRPDGGPAAGVGAHGELLHGHLGKALPQLAEDVRRHRVGRVALVDVVLICGDGRVWVGGLG